MQIESPTGIAWYSPGEAVFEVEVRGGREGSEEIDALPQFDWNNPFAAFHLAHELSLAPGEWIAHQHFRSSGQRITKDPVVETIALLSKRASAFNQAQPGYRVVQLDETNLEAALAEALERELSDAVALTSLPIGADLNAPFARDLYLAVVQRAPVAGNDRFFNPMVVWAALRSDDGRPRVEVAFLGDNAPPTPIEAMQETFGIDLREAHGAGWGVPETALSSLLGYDAEEIRLS
jgi:hypothetical protein